jgi:hypothetical protein
MEQHNWRVRKTACYGVEHKRNAATPALNKDMRRSRISNAVQAWLVIRQY